MSYLLNCSFSRVLHYLMFEVGGQNWIKLARIYWCEVLTKFWMNLIGNFQVEPMINSCWYLFIRYIGILTMTICCDGILRIKKNGMSQKNFRNWKKITSPAESKSGRCAKSCFSHWKWLEMTKVGNHMDLPLPDYWFVPKRTFELFLKRLERLV